jgi:hypothetical protein
MRGSTGSSLLTRLAQRVTTANVRPVNLAVEFFCANWKHLCTHLDYSGFQLCVETRLGVSEVFLICVHWQRTSPPLGNPVQQDRDLFRQLSSLPATFRLGVIARL